ncbi:MAG: pilus (MSHA type) biogenesis protein MshL [Zoogloeaceae bacterium]|nr:pilus (MSHA type) biogenesis protein MshL [Zoogloeaceae bacterium]
MNAIDQTLPQLLDRIAKQVDMRFELDGPNLAVMPDTPFLRAYKVDYVNMSRDTSGNVAINTQIASISPAIAGAAGAGNSAAAGGNVSSTRVDNLARNRFWETLEQNIKDILRETDKEIIVRRRVAEGQEQAAASAAGGAPAEVASLAARSMPVGYGQEYETLQAASVMMNRESGIMLARATSRQHGKIQEFLDEVLSSARRQVLIEATLVEVRLNRNYQQGIDWQYINHGAAERAFGQGNLARAITFDPATHAVDASITDHTLPSAVTGGLFSLAFRRGDFLAAVRLLENFGTLKVLSSPKLSVLNNQTAILKVVKNEVYFQVKADTSQSQTTTLTNLTTTPQSVSVGLVMSVTPQISENDSVLLNVRPTISRITGYKQDPHPSLIIVNNVPEIETREMESLMRVNDGDVAVLGGLMQDVVSDDDDAVPGLSKIPVLGNLFTHRNDTAAKTELVVFLRPTVIRDASIQGDYSRFRGQLPREDFFADKNAGSPQPAPEWRIESDAQ